MTQVDAVISEADGLARCPWSIGTPDYMAYHDQEWGRPVHGDTALFERITLEAFQSGLSWLTILRKREGFRRAFGDFNVEMIAQYDDADTKRLLADTGIVRNRLKVAATITNARALLVLQERDGPGALDALVWSFQPPTRKTRVAGMAQLPSSTPESKALSTALKKEGFVFIGPTTMYSSMQACGVVDDHVNGCFVGEAVH